ncbi:hypothetical protein RB623_29685 [Mesorhizobium sp. LHD-90]|uniref:hypothetical protein n=1 Tax=Mesorhizobium sp. LHD-90 TaxID=3071414 RepID=UPI0027E01E73|nr:hypothetical protein [Mesorhizobium sp. LHD-90]MDQ6438241.1 hypothetical protein [Mesorhizobium sp. LHD-90]
MRRKLLQYALPLAFFIAMSSAPASADLAAGAQATMSEAVARFDVLAKAEAAKNRPPRLADPAAKPVFDALFDREKILGEHPYKAADVETLLSVFSGYFGLTKVYIGFKDPAGAAADNEFNFQDELSRLAVEMVVAGGAIAQALNDYVATAPGGAVPEERKAGLAKLRLGVSQMVSGVITLLQNPRYSKENKILLADAIAEAAPYISAILPDVDRDSISQAAMQSLLNTPPEAESLINEFMNAMNSRECSGLCALK